MIHNIDVTRFMKLSKIIIVRIQSYLRLNHFMFCLQGVSLCSYSIEIQIISYDKFYLTMWLKQNVTVYFVRHSDRNKTEENNIWVTLFVGFQFHAYKIISIKLLLEFFSKESILKFKHSRNTHKNYHFCQHPHIKRSKYKIIKFGI